MSTQPLDYGPDSPFDADERRTIEAVYSRLLTHDSPQIQTVAGEIRRQMSALEQLGEVVASYPSPLDEQILGPRRRALQTLIEALSAATPANFEFRLPTKAVVGGALVIAEANFYRLLRHICLDMLLDEAARELADEATQRLRVCLYTKLAEEVLTALVTDGALEEVIRQKAAVALIQIWARRHSYRVADFFPILEATWEARQRITAIGGTLAGTQEIFALFQAGADPHFVDLLCMHDASEDEQEAFREFLFGTPTEELSRLADEMASTGVTSISLVDRARDSSRDAATVFYEFFGVRAQQARVRYLAELPGPKHTAEAYVMIRYLEQTP